MALDANSTINIAFKRVIMVGTGGDDDDADHGHELTYLEPARMEN